MAGTLWWKLGGTQWRKSGGPQWRKFGTLYADSMVADSYNVVDILYFDVESLEQQVVECKQYLSGPSDNKHQVIACYNDLHTNSNGKANIKFYLKN